LPEHINGGHIRQCIIQHEQMTAPYGQLLQHFCTGFCNLNRYIGQMTLDKRRHARG
jgi:hypothetical protein